MLRWTLSFLTLHFKTASEAQLWHTHVQSSTPINPFDLLHEFNYRQKIELSKLAWQY